MKKILIIITILFSIFSSTFAYELTEQDEILIEKIDNRAFNIIDSGKISAEKLSNLLIKYADNKAKSERLQEIIYAVADDLQYEYEIGEYASDDLEVDDYISDNFSGDNEDNWDDSELRAQYKIEKNKIIFVSGKEFDNDKKVFEMFAKLIPLESRKDIIEFRVYNNPEGGTAAFVEQDDNNKTKWYVTVNMSAFYIDGKLDFKESIHTLIHEYAHTLSLGKTQVNYSNIDENKCMNYLLPEGCLEKNAYLNKFIEKFWKEDFEKSQSGDENNDFYIKGNFVTEYAATNPGEDIAESFTFFVLKNKPTGNTTSDQKIKFFYQFKELVKLRNNIRKSLSELKK